MAAEVEFACRPRKMRLRGPRGPLHAPQHTSMTPAQRLTRIPAGHAALQSDNIDNMGSIGQ